MPVDNDVDVSECVSIKLPEEEEFMYQASTLAVLETAYFNANRRAVHHKGSCKYV